MKIKVNSIKAEIINNKREVLATVEFQTLDKRPDWRPLAIQEFKDTGSGHLIAGNKVRVTLVSWFGC